MEEPGYYNSRRCRGRDIHDMEYAIKRMEHDLKHAERERIHAIKDAMRNVNTPFAALHQSAASGPRTVDEVLVEVDSYLSYLEDLPTEKLAPYEKKISSLAEHLEKVRSSLKGKN